MKAEVASLAGRDFSRPAWLPRCLALSLAPEPFNASLPFELRGVLS